MELVLERNTGSRPETLVRDVGHHGELEDLRVQAVDQVLLRRVGVRLSQELSVELYRVVTARILVQVDHAGVPDVVRVVLADLRTDDLQICIREVLDVVRLLGDGLIERVDGREGILVDAHALRVVRVFRSGDAAEVVLRLVVRPVDPALELEVPDDGIIRVGPALDIVRALRIPDEEHLMSEDAVIVDHESLHRAEAERSDFPVLVVVVHLVGRAQVAADLCQLAVDHVL